MRVHMVTCNLGGMFPDDEIDRATYTGPTKEDLQKISSWKDGILSRLEPSDNLPLLITVCMQELGGKCKKNWEIMAAPGGFFSVMMWHLHEAVSELYASQGKSIWTSELAFNHHPTLPPDQHPHFFSGGPCPKQRQEHCSPPSSATAKEEEEGAQALQAAYPHIEPMGNVEGFTGLACLFMADRRLVENGRIQMFHFGEHKWMSPAAGLGSLEGEQAVTLRALAACHHRKMYTDSRKGFLHSRWWIREEAQGEEEKAQEGGREGDGAALRGGEGECVDVVNVHLIHDSSNRAAAAHSPSPASMLRQVMLRRILALVAAEESTQLWVVGDFNFRPDLKQVLEEFSASKLVELAEDSTLRIDVKEEDMWPLFRPKDRELAIFNRAASASEEAAAEGGGGGKEGGALLSSVRLFECGVQDDGAELLEEGPDAAWFGSELPEVCRWPPTYNVDNNSSPYSSFRPTQPPYPYSPASSTSSLLAPRTPSASATPKSEGGAPNLSLDAVNSSLGEGEGGGGGEVPAYLAVGPGRKHRYCKKRFVAWCDRILATKGAWHRLQIRSGAEAESAMGRGRLAYAKQLFDSDHDMVSLSFSI